MNTSQLSRPVRELIKTLRYQRKAALRECGRLGEKLHTARLEVESLRRQVKELEAKIISSAK